MSQISDRIRRLLKIKWYSKKKKHILFDPPTRCENCGTSLEHCGLGYINEWDRRITCLQCGQEFILYKDGSVLITVLGRKHSLKEIRAFEDRLYNSDGFVNGVKCLK